MRACCFVLALVCVLIVCVKVAGGDQKVCSRRRQTRFRGVRVCCACVFRVLALCVQELKQFEYAEAILNETLRLFPPGFVLMRECNEDYVYQGKRIPAGE